MWRVTYAAGKFAHNIILSIAKMTNGEDQTGNN